VAQPQTDHVVVLTEVYRVSPTLPLQTYRFGNWTAGGRPQQAFTRLLHEEKGLERIYNPGHSSNCMGEHLRNAKRLIRIFKTEQYSEIYVLGWIEGCVFHVTGMAG